MTLAVADREAPRWADLKVGHKAECAAECEEVEDRWVVLES